MTRGQILADVIQDLDAEEPGSRAGVLVLSRRDVGYLAFYLTALERQARRLGMTRKLAERLAALGGLE